VIYVQITAEKEKQWTLWLCGSGTDSIPELMGAGAGWGCGGSCRFFMAQGCICPTIL